MGGGGEIPRGTGYVFPGVWLAVTIFSSGLGGGMRSTECHSGSKYDQRLRQRFVISRFASRDLGGLKR